ncbi:MAG: hypothetical protein IPO08_16425 [Xanthomonadales bacterium]|jgi:hypothetical protein|nr:hypothetical protein [Xanthomonadales bacterium]
MVRLIFLILMLFLAPFSQVSCIDRCHCVEQVDGLVGKYQIVSVSKISGGLTSEKVAESWIGSEVLLEASRASALGLTIENPEYSSRCLPNKRVEGEVSHGRNPWDFGILPERACISILDVSKTDGASPFFEFEVIDGELWWIFDGWLIVSRR